jgi:hypothetical protein
VFARHLVESARLEDSALVLAVRLNWYRSVPLSCVERLEVELDGAGLPAERTTLELGGGRFEIGRLTDRDETWWPVLDAATVRVELDAPPSGGPHTVGVVLGTRIPYLVSPSGDAAVIVDRGRAEVIR